MDNLNFWPYTDIHELNLDWILEKVKELDTKLNDDIDTYVQEYIDEHFADWTVNANYDAATQTIVYTNGTGAQQTLGDVIRFAIDNVFVDIKDAIARTAAGAAQQAADDAQQTADTNTGAISTINNNIGDMSSLLVPGHSTIVDAINNTGYYKPGDTITATFECVGRGTSSGTDLYTYVILDKLINATDFTISVNSCSVYPTDSGASMTYNSSGSVGNKSISGTSARFTIPVNAAAFGRVAYIELSATITFI